MLGVTKLGYKIAQTIQLIQMKPTFLCSIVLFFVTFLSSSCSFFGAKSAQQATVAPIDTVVTTFFIVRHAEKTKDKIREPILTEAGSKRANTLADTLKKERLSAIYSTQYIRTQQTVQPTATAQQLEVKNYEAGNEVKLLESLLHWEKGNSVLIGGHSNTVPIMLNFLTDTTAYTDLGEQEYDNLFVVQAVAKGNAKVTVLKYGGVASATYTIAPHYHIDEGNLALKGFDAVEYVEHQRAIVGNRMYGANYQGINYHFASLENRILFEKNPEKYIPMYGGWCAFSLGMNKATHGLEAGKYPPNPKVFKIIDDRLYLFHQNKTFNALEYWNADEVGNKEKADAYWEVLNK